MNDETAAAETVVEKATNDRRIAIRVLITVAVAFLVAVGFSMLYTKRSTDQAKREARESVAAARAEAAASVHRLCKLYALIDDANSTQPPSPNPTVMEYRRLIHELRVGPDCR